MNPAVLDRLNENGALANIAACGGLVATAQFAEFTQLRPRTAQRAWTELANSKMVRLIRARQRPAFVVLTRRTVAALGSALPRPPNVTALRLINYQLGLARAEYFLQHEALLHSTSDLVRGRSKRQSTKPRIRRIVEAQQAQLKQSAARLLHQLKMAPTDALREKAMRIRRHLRDPEVIVDAGFEVLRHRWGLFLGEPTGVQPRFVFVDRATPIRLYEDLIAMLTKFSAATALRTSLDVVCGSELSQQRVEQHLSQTSLRLNVRILNLNYARYLQVGTALPALIGRERIASLLRSAPPPGDDACTP